jgi:hypothetical protein
VAFTDDSLATFMVTQLGPTGVALGLTVDSAGVVDAVAEEAAILGAAIPDLTDDLKTRIVGRWLAWRAALGAATGRVDLKAGSAGLSNSQSFDHILVMLRDAESAALAYPEVQAALAGAGGIAVVTSESGVSDPYRWRRWAAWG